MVGGWLVCQFLSHPRANVFAQGWDMHKKSTENLLKHDKVLCCRGGQDPVRYSTLENKQCPVDLVLSPQHQFKVSRWELSYLGQPGRQPEVVQVALKSGSEICLFNVQGVLVSAQREGQQGVQTEGPGVLQLRGRQPASNNYRGRNPEESISSTNDGNISLCTPTMYIA